jgi:hypothetical protein
VKCVKCGRDVAPEHQGEQCPSCGAPLSEAVLHWENRLDRGALAALLATVRDSLFRPTRLFRVLKPIGPYSWALLYALIVGTVGNLLGLVWHMSLGRFTEELPMLAGMGIAGTWVILATPVFVTVGVVVGSAIIHLCLLLVGGAGEGYAATFRAVAYSQAGQLWSMIPFCGGLIAFPWTLVLQVIALRELHRTSTGKAAAAVLIPIVLCCGAVLVAGLTMFSAFFAYLRGVGGLD